MAAVRRGLGLCLDGEEEQRERQMRNRMNKEFQIFVKRIEEQAKDLEAYLSKQSAKKGASVPAR